MLKDKDILGCMQCMLFVTKAFPGQSWQEIVVKYQTRTETEFKALLDKARLVFCGEATADIPVPCSVANTRAHSVEVSVTWALVTQAELSEILGASASSLKLKAKPQTFKDEGGNDIEGYLCSLYDFPAEWRDCVRKATVKYTTAIDLSEHLLDVEGQLHKEHGNALFQQANATAVAKRPKILKPENRWRVPFVGKWLEAARAFLAGVQAEHEEKASPAPSSKP